MLWLSTGSGAALVTRSLSTMSAAAANSDRRIVVCGGGIIGTSIAYYLTTRTGCKNVLLVDRVGIAPAASGKAGGFLALDWNDGSPVGALTRASFELHQELADSLGVETDYRRLTCEAVAIDGGRPGAAQAAQKKLQNVEWADLGAQGSRPMGDQSTIAQVHPKKLADALWAKASEAGATLRVGSVEGVERHGGGSGSVSGVRVDGETLPADAVVVAMGPWCGAAQLRLPPFYRQKYHSVLLRPERVLSQAVFFQGRGDPEVYPRPDGEVYVTGFPDEPIMVTEVPGAVEVRPEAVAKLVETARGLSSEFADAESAPVVGEQSCHLPCAPDGLPVIGALPGVDGAYVATGHSCWGILNAPATGLAMAELIVDGKAECVDLGPFGPARFGL